jgi:hypothetical protein
MEARTMDEGRRSRSIYLRVLLIALAVQAMTPDSHDLASPLLFEIVSIASPAAVAAFEATTIAPSVLDHESPSSDGGDRLPSKVAQEDGLLDESCVPAGLRVGVIPRRCPGTKARLLCFPPGPVKTAASIEQGRLSCSRLRILRNTDLTISLCQLTC